MIRLLVLLCLFWFCATLWVNGEGAEGLVWVGALGFSYLGSLFLLRN